MSLATLSAIAEASPDHNVECVPDLLTLAKLLFLSAGITKHQTQPDGERYFRAAACTGALYHIDLYLVCGELSDLSAGSIKPAPIAIVFGMRGHYWPTRWRREQH